MKIDFAHKPQLASRTNWGVPMSLWGDVKGHGSIWRARGMRQRKNADREMQPKTFPSRPKRKRLFFLFPPPHLGFIYLDLFKFRDGPFLHYEGMDQFDFEGGLLSMCFKDLYVWGLGSILRRLLSYEQPSFVHIGYIHQKVSRAPFRSENRRSQFHCPKSKIWKVWILLEYKYIIKVKLCDYLLLICGCYSISSFSKNI